MMPALFLVGLALAPGALTPPPAAATIAQPLGRAGAFGWGLHLELLDVGQVQGVSAGGHSNETSFGVTIQVDLGPHWAVRAPVTISAEDDKHHALAQSQAALGLVYRFRYSRDQSFVPFAGGGLLLGTTQVGRQLLGEAPVEYPLRSGAFTTFRHRAPDPDVVIDRKPAPQLWLGMEWHESRTLSLITVFEYAYQSVDGVGVHALDEIVGLRLSL